MAFDPQEFLRVTAPRPPKGTAAPAFDAEAFLRATAPKQPPVSAIERERLGFAPIDAAVVPPLRTKRDAAERVRAADQDADPVRAAVRDMAAKRADENVLTRAAETVGAFIDNAGRQVQHTLVPIDDQIMGVGNAIAGAVQRGSIGSLGEDYRAGRDDMRARRDRGEARFPVSSALTSAATMAGGVIATGGASAAGRLAPLFGRAAAPVVRGTGKAAEAANALAPMVARGSLGGYMESRSDDPKEQLKDAARGAAITSAIGTAGERVARRLVGSAPERGMRQRVGDLLEGEESGAVRGQRATRPVGERAHLLEEEYRQLPEIRAALRGPAEEALPVFKSRMSELNEAADPLYDTLDKEGATRSLYGLAVTLHKKAAEITRYMKGQRGAGTRPGGIEELRVIQKLSDKLDDHATGETRNAMRRRVSARALRTWATDAKKTAAAGIDALNAGEVTKAKEAGARIASEVWDEVLEKTAKNSPTAARAVEELRAINRPVAGYSAALPALEQRVKFEQQARTLGNFGKRAATETGAASLGGLFGHQVTGGDPIGTIIGAGAPTIIRGGAKVAARLSEELLEPLELAARRGVPRAVMLKELVSQGVPMAIAEGAVRAVEKHENDKKKKGRRE